MDFKDFETGIDDEDRRLDKIVRRFLPASPLSDIYKYIRKTLIKVNRKKTSPDYHIQHNDKISIAAFLLTKNSAESENAKSMQTENVTKTENVHKKNIQKKTEADCNFQIIFQNDDFLIISKPYGISVHGKENSLDTCVRNYISEHSEKQKSLSFHPGPLHRLDRNTTGILVFSKSLKGARRFSEELASHQIQKKYIGIMQGNLKEKQLWKDSIEKINNDEKKFHTVKASYGHSQKEEGSMHAITQATPLSHSFYKGKDITLTEFHILTGRKHQIRAQSALHGYPLLGDTAYGARKNVHSKKEYFLHAVEMMFPAEFAEEFKMPQTINCKVPEDFLEFFPDCNDIFHT